jgi:hypothetical protein
MQRLASSGLAKMLEWVKLADPCRNNDATDGRGAVVWKQGERRVGCDLHAFAARRAVARHRVVCAPCMAARPVGLARPATPHRDGRAEGETMPQCDSAARFEALCRGFGEAKPLEPSQAKHEQSEPKTSKAEPKASAASFVSPRLLCTGRCGFAFSATDSLVRRRRSGEQGPLTGKGRERPILGAG